MTGFLSCLHRGRKMGFRSSHCLRIWGRVYRREAAATTRRQGLIFSLVSARLLSQIFVCQIFVFQIHFGIKKYHIQAKFKKYYLNDHQSAWSWFITQGQHGLFKSGGIRPSITSKEVRSQPQRGWSKNIQGEAHKTLLHTNLICEARQRVRTQRGRLQDFSKKGQGTNKLCEVCHGARTSPPYIVKQYEI